MIIDLNFNDDYIINDTFNIPEEYFKNTKVKKLVFSDIINNKKTFDSTETKSLYSDISSLEVNFIN